ncbi:MAG: Bbp16 family capsid cement protein [Syntrophobacteraceae bacterium]
MIMDALLLLDGSYSSAGVLSGTSVSSGSTFTTGSQASANIIDLSNIASSSKGYGHDPGVGRDLELICLVMTTFTGSSSTLQVQLQYAPDGGSGTAGTWYTVAQSIAYALTSLVQGAELLRIALPPFVPTTLTSGGTVVPKFIQVNYVVGTANMTAGQILTCITTQRQALGPLMGYQSGYSNQYI